MIKFFTFFLKISSKLMFQKVTKLTHVVSTSSNWRGLFRLFFCSFSRNRQLFILQSSLLWRGGNPPSFSPPTSTDPFGIWGGWLPPYPPLMWAVTNVFWPMTVVQYGPFGTGKCKIFRLFIKNCVKLMDYL